MRTRVDVPVAAPLLAALLLGGCGGVAATRAPTPVERTQLVRAMQFWWRSSDAFAAVRMQPLLIGEIRIARRDPHYATMQIRVPHGEGQKLGYLHVGGVWQVVVGPGDWSGVCTSTSPQPFVDLYCR